jgi:hypothetical protein
VAALSVFSGASTASADDHDRDGYRADIRLYGGLWLGFGGEAEIEGALRGPFGLGEVRGSTHPDQVTTLGGQVGFDIPVLRFLSLGGEARFGTFNTETFADNDVDRSKLIDLDFKPRLTLPLRHSPIELYFTVPVGLTIPILADDFGGDDGIDGKLGWNLGIGAGINFWITRSFALNLEPNYLMHWFDLDVPVGSGSVKLQQFTLFLNAVLKT